MESNCAGLILHRQKPPLTRRSLVYYCSGVHNMMREALSKLDRQANEHGATSFTALAN